MDRKEVSMTDSQMSDFDKWTFIVAIALFVAMLIIVYSNTNL